jgi:hypothetical protein
VAAEQFVLSIYGGGVLICICFEYYLVRRAVVFEGTSADETVFPF